MFSVPFGRVVGTEGSGTVACGILQFYPHAVGPLRVVGHAVGVSHYFDPPLNVSHAV